MTFPELLAPTISEDFAAGEHVRWWGRPNPLLVLTSLAWMGAFVIPWTFCVGQGVVRMIRRGDIGGTMVTFGMTCIGLIMALMPVRQYFLARRTVYVITNRRLIVAAGQSVQSLYLDDIKLVERRTRLGRTVLSIPTDIVKTAEGRDVIRTVLYGPDDADQAYRLLAHRLA